MITLPIVGTKFCDATGRHVAAHLAPGDAVELVREPRNKYDRNAIRVEALGHKIGYLPGNKNRELARFMDARQIERMPAVAGLGRAAGPTVEIEPLTNEEPAK